MTAVILLAHGSPDPRSARATRVLAATVESRLYGTTVRTAFLQHDEPDLATAVVALAAEGHDYVVVVPALLTVAVHARQDVPAAVADAERASGIPVVVTDPIGPDGALLDALDRSLPAGPAVLATAGTSDDDAQRALAAMAQAWSDRRSAPVILGYASQADPDIATAISTLEAQTGERAAVGSYVLFPGVLPDRIAEAAGDRAMSDPLFGELETVAVIESRIAGALRRAA